MRLPSVPSIVLALGAFGLVLAQDVSLAAVKQAFVDANIPQDINLAFDPKVLLQVTFPEPNGVPITLHAGVSLPRNATVGPPSFSLQCNEAAGRGPFVVAAVDPDAPTPQMPTRAQIRHFLGGNFVLEEDLRLVNSTPALSAFLQPTPPAGSDPHRYIFLLFDQPEGFNDQTLVTLETSVANFNLSAFAESVGLGEPIGGTFMLVGPDPPSTA